jgi:hypothetical protein
MKDAMEKANQNHHQCEAQGSLMGEFIIIVNQAGRLISKIGATAV